MKKTLLFLLIILIIGGGIYYFFSFDQQSNQTTIQGLLGYPSEKIPSNIKVCAQSINNDNKYCTTDLKQTENSKYKKYQLEIKPGNYIVVAHKNNDFFKGYYSTYVKCGLQEECISHFPITINVKQGDQLTGINVLDWFNRTRTFTNQYRSHNFNIQLRYPEVLNVKEDLRSKEIYFQKDSEQKPSLTVIVHENSNNLSLDKWALNKFELKDNEFKIPIIFGNKDYQALFLKTYKSIGTTKEVDRILYKKDDLILELNSGLPSINSNNERNSLFSQVVSTFQEIENEVNVSNPEIGSEITSPVTINGKATGDWFFEGQLQIQLIDNDGNIISSVPGKTNENWQTENLVSFEGSLEFTTDKEKGKILIKKDNPSGLPKNADQIEIPVYFK